MKTKQTILIIIFIIIIEIMTNKQNFIGKWTTKNDIETEKGTIAKSIEIKHHTPHNKMCYYGAKAPNPKTGAMEYEHSIHEDVLQNSYIKPSDKYKPNSTVGDVANKFKMEMGIPLQNPMETPVVKVQNSTPKDVNIETKKETIEISQDSDINTLSNAIQSMKNSKNIKDEIILGLSLNIDFSVDRLVGVSGLMGFDNAKLVEVLTKELTSLITQDKINEIVAVEVNNIINGKQ